MSDLNRRNTLKAAAWSVPVIAAAIAAPAAAASIPPQNVYPTGCVKIPNHGHGGNTGQLQRWIVTYSDNTTKNLSNSEVNSDKFLKSICKK